MPTRLSRRRFLYSSALAAGAGGLWPHVLRAEKNKPSANERLHVGAIGIGGMGGGDLYGVAGAGAEIVALCDVVEGPVAAGPNVNSKLVQRGKEVAAAREKFKYAKFHTDFRRLFDQKGLDAVIVGTPDHSHAPATMMALRAGLHVYCEKPLTHTVTEARLVAETAAKMKRVTQMGTQIHAGSNYRRVVELIQGGAIGPVKEVHVWCDRQYVGHDRPKESFAVPAGLNWDLWLGAAPYRPYHPTYLPFDWREWWDFGGGTLNDMACHHVDLPFWALKLRHPTKVRAEGPPLLAEGTPPTLKVEYEFPSRDGLPPVQLTWYHGGLRPRYFKEGKLPKWGDGSLFVGEKGMLLANYGDRKLLPEEKFAGFVPPAPSIPESIGHHKEWVEACKNGGPTTCNFSYSGALTEAVLLGTVSYRSGKAFTWDASALKTSEPEADRWLHKEYRKGWSL
jgi:predicted dehydrogenase